MKSTLYRFPDGLYWIPDTSPPKAKYGTGPFDSNRAAYLWYCCRMEDSFTGEKKALWAEAVALLGPQPDAGLLMGIAMYIAGEYVMKPNEPPRQAVLKMAKPYWDRRSLAAGERV